MIYSTVEPAPNLVILLTCERLDAVSCPQFVEDTNALMTAENFTSLKIDFSDVSFVDSTGLGAIVNLLKKLPSPDMLTLCGLNTVILELLQLTRLDEILTIEK